ncbi:FkbM family methyltransferase [Bernardetia sp. ABR2-2B]|uniref:FkbM family methyltransferase n=1 Tax=Bernardetia sp. ABR2-2B TaxID=3127472 RepID=UPI0030CCDAC6
MRKELFYNPLLLIERLGEMASKKMRRNRLKNTVMTSFHDGHIESLEILEMIKNNYPNGIKTIFDIGGNIGSWTLLAKTIFPQAEIHAFEPLEKFANIFKRNTEKFDSVAVHQFALGNQETMSEMHVAGDSSSLLPLGDLMQEQYAIQSKEKTQIQTVILDNYIKEKNIPQPDFIKLDIQGYELEALKGAENAMKNAKYVFIEVSLEEFYIGQPLLHDVVAFMAEHNFYATALKKQTHVGQRLYQTDILFEKR